MQYRKTLYRTDVVIRRPPRHYLLFDIPSRQYFSEVFGTILYERFREHSLPRSTFSGHERRFLFFRPTTPTGNSPMYFLSVEIEIRFRYTKFSKRSQNDRGNDQTYRLTSIFFKSVPHLVRHIFQCRHHRHKPHPLCDHGTLPPQ